MLIELLSEEERQSASRRTKGGILIPDTADKEKPQEGKVVAVGEGKVLENGKLQPMSIKVGDRVLFSKYGPSEIKLGDDKEYLIAKEEDILAIIN